MSTTVDTAVFNTKSIILQNLLAFLFEKSDAIKKAELREIMHSNCTVRNIYVYTQGFRFEGKEYWEDYAKPWDLSLLHESLHGQMRKYLEFEETFRDKKIKIHGWLINILTKTDGIYELYCILPDSLKGVISHEPYKESDETRQVRVQVIKNEYPLLEEEVNQILLANLLI